MWSLAFIKRATPPVTSLQTPVLPLPSTLHYFLVNQVEGHCNCLNCTELLISELHVDTLFGLNRIHQGMHLVQTPLETYLGVDADYVCKLCNLKVYHIL